MSFNKKRLPDLNILKAQHAELGDTYLNQFISCDVLVGSAESAEYLSDFFKLGDRNSIGEIISLLTTARNTLKKESSKYQKDFEDLEKVINSITNK